MLMKLYHGTSNEAAEEIKESGEIYGPVYLTGDRSLAEDYTLNWNETGVVIAIEIDTEDLEASGLDLQVDMERLNENPGIEWALDGGESVYCEHSISTDMCEFISVGHE